MEEAALDHDARLASVRRSIDTLSGLSDDDLDTVVPTCPGWTVRTVIAHLAYQAGIGWTAMMGATPESAAAAVGAALSEAPPERGVELFDDVMETMVSTIAAHRPDDPCPTFFGAGSFDFWALHAASEICLHRLDVELALGCVVSLTTTEAHDGLTWSASIMPRMAHTYGLTPPGSLSARATEGGEWLLGGGEPAASIAGGSTSLYTYMWGRPTGSVALAGDASVVNWWRDLPASTFQHPALG